MSVFMNQRIDFNNPMINKPTNLQNSAVLRMLEEEENRKRSGEPGVVKRVAWPPPPEDSEGFVEQAPVQAQGGPNPTVTSSSPQVHYVPIQQQPPAQRSNPSVTSSNPQVHYVPIQQQPPVQRPNPTVTSSNPQVHNVPTQQQPPAQRPNPAVTPSNPHVHYVPIQQQPPAQSSPVQEPPQRSPVQDPEIFTSSATFLPSPQPRIQTKSPDFTTLAKPWSPQQSSPGGDSSSSQFRSVSYSPSSSSYQSSKVTEYSSSREYQYSTKSEQQHQQQYQLQQQPSVFSKEISSFSQVSGPVFTPAPAPEFRQQTLKEEAPKHKLAEKILTVKIERSEDKEEGGVDTSRQAPISPRSAPKAPPKAPVDQNPVHFVPIQRPYSSPQVVPSDQITSKPQQTQPNLSSSQGSQVTSNQFQQPKQPDLSAQQGQVEGVPQRTFAKPKQVEPPPSTITLRPQAPVSQAPPPLVSSQPATAKFRGGKNLRGDLKWPPEDVRERMAAEKQHLVELAKGPACRPKRQHKDYTPFFSKHQVPNTYPGYKIPPGTQFYEHNPVM